MAVGVLLAVLAVGLSLLFTFGRVVRSRGWSNLNLPPGPPGIPVLGNLFLFTGSKPHIALTDLAKRYGPLVFLRLGSTPCVVASSPELYEEFYKTQDAVFASKKSTSAVEQLLYHGKDIAFAPYGEYWRQIRKLTTMELLSQKKISQFESFRVAEVSKMVRAVYQDAVHGGGMPAVNLSVMFKALTFNFSTQITFSKRFYEYDSQAKLEPVYADDTITTINAQEAKEFVQLIAELNFLLGIQLIGDFLPKLSFLDRFTGFKARIIKAHKRTDEFLSRIVEERRKHPNSKQATRDFLDVLLELEPKENYLDESSVKALCLDMVVGGTDTSANALEWIMTEIVRNPRIGAKLQAEMDAVVGKGRLVTEADIPDLPYLVAVVKEVFRFHPNAGLNVPHVASEQTKVMGYDIPQSTLMFANFWATNRDPTLWDNPLEFRPERFIDNPEIDVKGQNYKLIPFGTGRRGCPGTAFALIMVQYTLARLVQAFDWAPPKGMEPEDLNVEESGGLTLPRAHPLHALATPRSSFFLF